MFTIGYRSNFSCIFRAMISIAVGLVLIIVRDAPALLVQIIAAFIALGGAASVVSALVGKGPKDKGAGIAGGIISLIIAALLYVYAGKVAIAVYYVVAFMLVISGITQLGAFSSILNFQGFGFFSIIVSGIIVAGGIIMLILLFNNAHSILRLLSVLAGSFLIVYGLMDLINSRKIRKTISDYYAPDGAHQEADEQ